MSAPANPTIELNVSRGTGLYLHLNGRLVDDSYGAIVMAELAQLRDFPDVRVDARPNAATSRPGHHGAADRHGARPRRNLGLRAGRAAVRERFAHRCRAGAGQVGPASSILASDEPAR
jgi:hypothetical protein